MAGAIGSVIMIGSVKSLSFSLQASQVARAGLTELELRNTINLALGGGFSGSCGTNLNPKTGTLKGDNKAKGIGYVDRLLIDGQMPPAIQTGESFKGDLRIVKMALKGDESTDPKTSPQNRHFIVYYRKENLGAFSSIGQQKCQAKVGSQAEDLSGCYYSHCLLSYGLNTDEEVTRCQVMDCQSNTQVQFRPCGGNTFFYGFDSWDGTPICGPFPEDLVPDHESYDTVLRKANIGEENHYTAPEPLTSSGFALGRRLAHRINVEVPGAPTIHIHPFREILMGTNWNAYFSRSTKKSHLGDLRADSVGYVGDLQPLLTQLGYTWKPPSIVYNSGVIHKATDHIIDCMCSHISDAQFNSINLTHCSHLAKHYNSLYSEEKTGVSLTWTDGVSRSNQRIQSGGPTLQTQHGNEPDMLRKILYMRQKHKNKDFKSLIGNPLRYGYPDCYENSQVFLSLPLPCPDGFFWNTNLCSCERYPVSPVPPVPDCGTPSSHKWPAYPYVRGLSGVLAGVNRKSLYCVKLLTARLVDPNEYEFTGNNCEKNWTAGQKSANRFVHEFCKHKDDPFPEDANGQARSACPEGEFFNLVTCTCDLL